MKQAAIVGAGFCGSMTAVHLLRGLAERRTPAEILLIERSGRFTAGIAYGTRSAAHLLNVPAGRMSAFPEDPDHFLRWARAADPRVSGGAFVARSLYGAYLADILTRAEEEARGVVRLRRIPQAAISLTPEPAALRLDLTDGSAHRVDLCVLAIGNFPPGNPPLADESFFECPEYVRDPWTPGAFEGGSDQPVLLLGTGLTMLDAALALRERGHTGMIHAISRRGLLPQPHRVSIKPPPGYPRPAGLDHWPATARGLVRALRAEVRGAAQRGINWREVVTALRADTPRLWRSLAPEERRRFLQRLRPFWETHRHRAAPDTAADIAEMIDRGELVLHAGQVTDMRKTTNGVAVKLRLRRGAPARLLVARVINCTGPETDLRRVGDPLIVQLRSQGLIRPDPLGLGLETAEDGAVLDADGRASARLFLAGPLRKGLLWENTAVPELRVEVARLAERLLASLTAMPGELAAATSSTASTHPAGAT